MKQNRNQKKLKRIASFLAVLCCLAGSVIWAAAMRVDHNIRPGMPTEPVNPQVTFVNEPDTRPNLSIKKVVQDSEGHLYTDETTPDFTFILSLGAPSADGTENLKPVNAMEYRLYGADGTEHFTADNNFHKTSSSGVFTLKAGEKAVFEYLGGYSYRIEEIQLPEKYQCKDGVSVMTGTLSQNKGETIEFINVYSEKGDGDETTLRVSKLTPFQQTLKDYEMPEQMPEFTFRISLADEKGQLKPYYQEPYDIVRTLKDGREIKEGTGATDDNGEFAVPAGCTVVFANVPVGVDYEVHEVTEGMPEGWWSVGDMEQSGFTTAPETAVSFVNSNLSFMVTKTMEDGSLPDDEFWFELTDKDGKVMENAEYYLYDMTSVNRKPIPVSGSGQSGAEEETGNDGTTGSGNEADSETQNGGTNDSQNPGDGMEEDTGENADQQQEYIRRTDDKGRFALKAGQAALFIGIQPGTYYRVSEIANSKYDQVTPSSSQGYLRPVLDNTVRPAPFVNRPVPVQPGELKLSVTKTVENEKGERPVTQDEFQFILLKEKADETSDTDGASGETNGASGVSASSGAETAAGSGVYEPVENATYSVMIMGESHTYSTGKGEKAGVFTLGANQTARFSLKEPGKYMVKEFDLTEEYTVDGGPLYTVSEGQMIPVDGATLDSIQDNENPSRKYAQAQQGVLSAEKSELAFTFTNRYTPKKWDLELIKTNQNGAPVENVKFILYRDQDMTDPIVDETHPDGVRTTVMINSDGGDGNSGDNEKAGFTISGLQIGTYWLKEVECRAGYALLPYPIQIKVYRENSETKVDLIVDGVRWENPEGKYRVQVVQSGGIDIADTVTVTVQNEQLYELPSSGGIGIYWYLIGGVLLMMAAALILYRDKLKYAGRLW